MSARSHTRTRQHLERHQFKSRPTKCFACHCLVLEFPDVRLVGTTQERTPETPEPASLFLQTRVYGVRT